jgi:ABC-type amino acid transport substrate-binding protein
MRFTPISAPRRFELRSVKYILLIASLILAAAGCGKKEKAVPGAEESMQKNKKVNILTDAVNAPFEFGSGTGVQGYDIDIGNEIGKTLNIEVKWTKVSGNERMLELLKKGEAEIIISAMAIDPKKSADFDFSEPYFDSGDAIAVARDSFDIKGLEGLSGKKVGVAAERPGDRFMATQTLAKGASASRYKTLDDALLALNHKEVEAVVGDEPILTYSSVKSFPNTSPLPNVTVNKYQYAVVVRKGETELLSKINETLRRLKSSGDLDKWKATWFGNVKKVGEEQRKKDVEEERLKKAPKTINVNITKVSGAWNMDRFDGFVLVLRGPAGQYQSNSINTEGNRGTCKFTQPVPPGEYTLNLSIIRMSMTVTVPELSKASLTMDMRLPGTIQFR